LSKELVKTSYFTTSKLTTIWSKSPTNGIKRISSALERLQLIC
jgi:hypothetical protein